MQHLTIQEKIWLTLLFTDPCPYCGKVITFKPRHFWYRLARTRLNKNGVRVSVGGFFGCTCPHCNNDIKVEIDSKFTKVED